MAARRAELINKQNHDGLTYAEMDALREIDEKYPQLQNSKDNLTTIKNTINNIENLDNYIKVYNVTSQREFDYINTLTMNSYYNNIYSKFEWGISNNIIFVSILHRQEPELNQLLLQFLYMICGLFSIKLFYQFSF